MKYFRYILLFAAVLLSWSASAQNVSNADFYQDGKNVVITYSLDQAADVSVQVSTDGGVTFSAPLRYVSGNVGKNVQAGNNRIVWDVLSEYDKLVGEQFQFLISAVDKFPYLQVVDYTITGSSSSILKPRVPFDLQVLLQNTSSARAEDVLVTIHCPENVYILGGEEHTSIVTIEGGQTISLVYSLVSNALYTNPTIPIQISIQSKTSKIENRTLDLAFNTPFNLAKQLVEQKSVPLSIKDKRSFTVNGVTFNMIYVQGGTFTMGATSEQGNDAADSEKPAHQVKLSDYYIGETEVTQALWQAVMGTTIQQQRNKVNYSDRPLVGTSPEHPMYYINWNECRDFVQKLSQLTEQTFRLPTEAEWEFAARGGNKSAGYKYSGSNRLNDVAWYMETTNESGTKPVATKQANELGIYDMSGNVWEWCSDGIDRYRGGLHINPQVSSSGTCPVMRGGSWDFGARSCRVSSRSFCAHEHRQNLLGLRLVLVP